MKLYAVMNGPDSIVSETITANPDFAKADMFRLQSRDDKSTYYVVVFDQVEKLTPPATAWTSEVVVAEAPVVVEGV